MLSSDPNHRFASLDGLRGLTIMLMILVNNPGSWGHVYPPFLHAPWHGCTMTDLVFPFFLFIVDFSHVALFWIVAAVLYCYRIVVEV